MAIKKYIDGKEDTDRNKTIYLRFKCGKCFNVWQEEVYGNNIVLPSGTWVKEMGYRSQCPKCRKKDVFLVDEQSTRFVIDHIPTEELPL